MSSLIKFRWFSNVERCIEEYKQKRQSFYRKHKHELENILNDIPKTDEIGLIIFRNHATMIYTIKNNTFYIREVGGIIAKANYTFHEYFEDIVIKALEYGCSRIDGIFVHCLQESSDFYKIQWMSKENEGHGIISFANEVIFGNLIMKHMLVSYRGIEN